MSTLAATPAVLPAPARPSRLQGLAARLTGSGLFWACLVATSFGLPLVRSLLRPLPPPPPVLGALPEFSAVDQEGRTFGKAEARGRLLIAEFAAEGSFAGPASVLNDLQRNVRNTADAVRLVSFIERPAGTDPGAGLPALAKAARAGEWRWVLAGVEGDALRTSVERNLGLPDGTLLGGKRLLLVDRKGRIRRNVGTSRADVDQLMRDISLVANLDPS